MTSNLQRRATVWLAVSIVVLALGGCGTSSNSTAGGASGSGAGGATGSSGSAGSVAGAAGPSGAGTAGTAGGTATPTDLNAPAGTLGGTCTTDADCASAGLKCLTPAGFDQGTKYCASTCTVADDCQAFAASSYAISVPADSSVGPNAWGTTLLQRGVICGTSSALGGTQKYCQFVCRKNEAVSAGSMPFCACLPRYGYVTDAAGNKTGCEFDEQSVCSIVNYPGRRNVCDACNSAPLVDGCYTGDYRCGMNLSFNGTCYQWFDSTATLDQCLAAGAVDCDSSCTESCLSNNTDNSASGADACSKLCCKPSTRSASMPPECAAGAAGSGAGGTTGSVGGGSGLDAGVGGSVGTSQGGGGAAGVKGGGGGPPPADAGVGGTKSGGGGAPPPKGGTGASGG